MIFKNLSYNDFDLAFQMDNKLIQLHSEFGTEFLQFDSKNCELDFYFASYHEPKDKMRDIKISFKNAKLLYPRFDGILNVKDATFHDLQRISWDDKTGYEEQSGEMLIEVELNNEFVCMNDLEYIVFTCSYFEINFIDEIP